ncbi:serine protease HTRA2, mitochondrial [Leptinotarsa decemlineata]|uniref:serine protease HTRA2, mitochondrial n=1 Tax=Leptinotarsa decemlineata TaxID=7539 RepID=UPI003D308E2A
MRDGRSFKVQVEDADMSIDLALLKLDALEKLPSLQLETPGDTAIGEWVVALGSPLSLSNSVTVGIVSCVDRPAEELGLKNYSMTYIQTDASITFGNSGGPLVNLDGNVIGINNLRLTSGISFAIPVEYAKKFLENSKYRVKSGRSIGPMGKTLFGITTISITPEVLSDLLRENSKIPNDVIHGLLVWKIIPGSPASQCGMEVGDIITHVNGVPVKEAADLYLTSGNKEIIEIKLIHAGKKKSIALHPEDFQ